MKKWWQRRKNILSNSVSECLLQYDVVKKVFFFFKGVVHSNLVHPTSFTSQIYLPAVHFEAKNNSLLEKLSFRVNILNNFEKYVRK